MIGCWRQCYVRRKCYHHKHTRDWNSPP